MGVDAVLTGMSGSRRDQPMEFMESRKDVEAIARRASGGLADLLHDLTSVSAPSPLPSFLAISNAPRKLIGGFEVVSDGLLEVVAVLGRLAVEGGVVEWGGSRLAQGAGDRSSWERGAWSWELATVELQSREVMHSGREILRADDP